MTAIFGGQYYQTELIITPINRYGQAREPLRLKGIIPSISGIEDSDRPEVQAHLLDLAADGLRRYADDELQKLQKETNA